MNVGAAYDGKNIDVGVAHALQGKTERVVGMNVKIRVRLDKIAHGFCAWPRIFKLALRNQSAQQLAFARGPGVALPIAQKLPRRSGGPNRATAAEDPRL